MLSEFLNQEGVKHAVLNARFHESEAQIVAQAGRKGAVTIATNMAGRGTDIKLGGNLEMRVEDELRDMPEGPEREAAIARIEAEIEAEKQEVLADGGIGRASGRERVGQYVLVLWVAGSLKKKPK